MNKSTKSLLKYFKQLSGKDHGVFVPRVYVGLCGDFVSAAIFSQLLYWDDRTKDPEGWIAKPHNELFDEIGVTEFQERRAIHGDARTKKTSATLQNFGVETKVSKSRFHNGDAVTHYRINHEILDHQILKYIGNSDLDNVEISTPSDLDNVEISDLTLQSPHIQRTQQRTETENAARARDTLSTSNPMKWTIPHSDRHQPNVTIDPLMFPIQCEAIFEAWKAGTQKHGYTHVYDDDSLKRHHKAGIENVVLFGYKPDDVATLIDELYTSDDNFWRRNPSPITLKKVAELLPNMKRETHIEPAPTHEDKFRVVNKGIAAAIREGTINEYVTDEIIQTLHEAFETGKIGLFWESSLTWVYSSVPGQWNDYEIEDAG